MRMRGSLERGVAEAGDEDLETAGVKEIVIVPEVQEDVPGGDNAAAAFAKELKDVGLAARNSY